MNTNRSLALATAGVLTALALTGCSSDASTTEQGDHGGPAPQSNVFEFESPTYFADPGELTIRLPQALTDIAGDDADGLLVTSITATSRELESPKYCAVDVTLGYADGGLETASKLFETQAEHDLRAQSALEEALEDSFGVTTVEEANAEALEQVKDRLAEGMKGNGFDEAKVSAFLDAAPEQEVADWKATAEQQVDTVVASVDIGAYTAAKTWKTLDSTPVGDLDSSDPKSGTYVAPDFKTLTLVAKCATSRSDDDSSATASFSFPNNRTDSKREYGFATVEMTVMKDGTVTITDSGVHGYTRDSNGDWIAD